jgi:predicted ATPase/DNA-binding CsgD family transcriptional regulator
MEAGGNGPAPGGGRGLLPALTTFVGRAGEVDEVAGLLDRYRLVTVTGPGGVGKTRLAAEVAARVAARFADGVALAELASVQDQAQVPAAVAAVLGIREAPDTPVLELLAGVLGRQQVLLVLDNCEHVLDVVARLCEAVLPLADDVRVLATSREPIGVGGETRYRLGPLAVPRPGPDQPGRCAAVELFADRARRVDPGFALDDASAQVIGQVVARLDGMPLAIELAAARVEALGLGGLLDRLDDRFMLLTSSARTAPARQRSLTATVDWSYQLLSEQEKQVFRRLAIFSGPFTLDAAETVAGNAAGPAVLKLVDCSLITPPRAGPDGRGRYLMLETLRAFGLDRLTEAGERPGTEALLVQHMLAVAERAAAEMTAASTEAQAAAWLDAEDAAMHQALVWALDHDPAAALLMAVELGPWWMLRGRRIGPGYAWLRTATERVTPGDPSWCAGMVLLGEMTQDLREALGYFTAVRDAIGRQGPSPVLADALAGRSICLLNMGRVPEAQQEAHNVLAMARGLGYPAGEMVAMTALGVAARFLGDIEQALEWHRQASQIDPAHVPARRVREQSVPWVQTLIAAGQMTEAGRSCADGLARARAANDLPNLVMCLKVAADLDLQAGRATEAGPYLAEAIELCLGNGFRFSLTSLLDTCGHLCAASGRGVEALTLWAALAVFMDRGSIADLPEDLRRREEARQEAAGALAEDRIRAAEGRGASMTLDTAAEYALVVTTQEAAGAPPELARLSAREQELVTLVAQGSTDAQIAAQLYISISTVRSHLDRIRDKTSCRRRADLTRLALRAGLV